MPRLVGWRIEIVVPSDIDDERGYPGSWDWRTILGDPEVEFVDAAPIMSYEAIERREEYRRTTAKK